MFFDDSTKRKPAGRVQLRLAADADAPELGANAAGKSEAVRRHQAARQRRETAGPSLLDQIDEISRRQAAAEREVRARAALEAELEALTDKPVEAYEARRRPHTVPTRYPGDISQALPADSGQWQEPAGTHARGADYRHAMGDEDGAPLIDPRFVFSAVKRLRYVIAATTVLGGLAGAYIAINTPKLYYSSATIVVDPRNYKVIENDLNPDVFLSEAALAIVDSQVSLMRSPRVLEKVAANLKLANDPEFNGSARRGLGSFLGMLTSGNVEDYEGSALKYLAEHMSAERSPKTFVVNVGAYSEDPQKAALIANAIVDVYLEEQSANRSDTAKRTSGELGSRLDSLKAQVEEAEKKVEAYKSENNLVGAQGRLIEDEEILRVNDQLTAARSTTITLNARAQSAKAATVEAVASGGLPEEVASSGLTALRSQYVAAKQRRDGLSAKLGPMHPDLKQADNELSSLAGAINAEIGRIRTSLQTDLKRAVETEQQLAARLAQLKARQSGSGEAQVELRELEREAASARTVYEQFLLRARETGEQGSINANNIQKISEARPADAPEGASRKIIAIGGAIAGFIAGFGLAVAKGMFDALMVRFGSGGGMSAPLPSPPARPSGGGPRRKLSNLFSGRGKDDGAAEWRPTAKAPQPSMHHGMTARAQFQPAGYQEPQANPVAPVAHSPQPVPPQPSLPYPQPVMHQAHYPVYREPAQPPVMQPVYAQPVPAYAQPWYPPQPMVLPQPVPLVHHQPFPQMIQPVFTPQVFQPQAAPQQAPVMNAAPPLHHADPVANHAVPQRHVQAPAPELGGIQESLDDLRMQLLDLANRRRFG